MVSLAECRSAVACYGFSVETLVDYYLQWVVEPFYVIVSGWNGFKKDFQYASFASVKRGDERYARRVMHKFRNLSDEMKDKVFFTFGERDRSKIESRVVFASLTYDRKMNLEDTWRFVGKDFNRWITRLRKRFGKIDVVRCFESQVDGYCHIHAVLLFKETKLRGFRWDKFKNGHRIITYRVDNVEPFKVAWGGGFSDVQLCHSVKGAFRYISKYLVKTVYADGEEGNPVTKTLALSWFFHKRVFSVSGDIAKVYSDLIFSLNSNSNSFVPYFLLFDGSKLECEVAKWHLYGFLKGDHVKWKKNFQLHDRSEIDRLEDEGLIDRPERFSYASFSAA